MPNSVWLSEFDGTSGTAVESTTPITGTIGTPIDFLANGGVVEVNGSGEALARQTTATALYVPITGYTVATVSRSYVLHIRAGGTDAANSVSCIVFADAPSASSFYDIGVSSTGLFVDRYTAGALSGTLYLSTTGITSGTLHSVRVDVYTTGRIVLWLDGAQMADLTDGSPITPDGSPEYLAFFNTGPSATRPQLSRFETFDGLLDEVAVPAGDVGSRWWRLQLAAWQQASAPRRGPLPADVIDTNIVRPDVRAALATIQWWRAQVGLWQQQSGLAIAPLSEDVAGGDANATASGVLVLSGTATASSPRNATASGGLTLVGSATATSPRNAVASGALVLSGAATATVTENATASGVLVLSGSATATTGAPEANATASGVLVLTGSGAMTTPRNAQASGELVLGGAAAATSPRNAVASGVLVLRGLASAEARAQANASGNLVLVGSATAGANPIAYATASGVLVLTGAASAATRLNATATGRLNLVSLTDGGGGEGGGPVLLKRRRYPFFR